IEPTSQDYITFRDRWLALLIAVVGTLVFLPGAFWGLPGGKSICGALRVLEGQVPYRDFWTMYAPGQFYATAGLYRIFGRECLIQGIAAILINGAIGGVLFLVARRAGARRPMAVVVSALIVASFWGASSELKTYAPALLCAFFAVERVLCYFQKGGRSKLFVAGILLGTAACFKHDVAFYILAPIIVTLFTSWFGIARRRCSIWSHPLGATFVLAGGAALIAIPAVLLLWWSAGEYAWRDLIVWPATDFRGVRTEGFPPLLPNWTAIRQWAGNWSDLRMTRDVIVGQSRWILCNMPQYVFIITTGALLFLRRRIAPTRLASSVLLLSMLPLFWIVAHVQDNTHVKSMAIFSLCLMAMAWPSADTPVRRRKLLRGVLGIGMAIYTIGLMASPASSLARIALNWSDRQYLGLPGARGIWVSKEQYDVYYPIISFIHQHVPPDERIYVGLKRHDVPVINNLRFYYLAGRRNCCRYDELHPGIVDRADVQQEIIDAIERYHVRCVVIWRFGWPDSFLDEIKTKNMAAVPGLGNTHLDTFINETFQPLEYYGEYVLMWRKGLPSPKAVTVRTDDNITGH
ncbi:MAG: hypothetical protein ACYS19_15640, partial [Planctomycetota bacterium]